MEPKCARNTKNNYFIKKNRDYLIVTNQMWSIRSFFAYQNIEFLSNIIFRVSSIWMEKFRHFGGASARFDRVNLFQSSGRCAWTRIELIYKKWWKCVFFDKIKTFLEIRFSFRRKGTNEIRADVDTGDTKIIKRRLEKSFYDKFFFRNAYFCFI